MCVSGFCIPNSLPPLEAGWSSDGYVVSPFFIICATLAGGGCMQQLCVQPNMEKKANSQNAKSTPDSSPKVLSMGWLGNPTRCCCRAVELRCTAAFKTVCQSFFHIIDCLLDYKPRHWLEALFFISHFIPLLARALASAWVMSCQQHRNQHQQFEANQQKTRGSLLHLLQFARPKIGSTIWYWQNILAWLWHIFYGQRPLKMRDL